MANITARKNKSGETVYKVRACVGRDETYKQIWRSCTILHPEGLTPAKAKKEVERQADAWEQEQRALFKKDHSGAKSTKDKQTITLEQFIKTKWIPLHVNNGKHTPETIAFYGYMADDIISYFGNHIKIREIGLETVERYGIYLRTKAKTKKEKSLSETTIRRHLETLRNILRYAITKGYMTEDVFEKYTIESKSDEAKTVDFLTPDEAKTFMIRLKEESVYWQALITIALKCGLRRGEIVGLQWNDIDFDSKRIYIQRNVTVDTHSSTGVHIGEIKNKKKRYAWISDNALNLLKSLFGEQSELYYIPADGFIFHTPSNVMRPLYPTSPETWIKRFEKRNGLRPLSMHDLRHTAGTLAKIAGADLKDIQTMLGHSDLKTTTKFYLGVDEEAQRRTVEGIDSLIG